MSDPLVIVGSGLAGYTLAREWRKLDTTTPLVVVSRDAAGFYSKPMLSNALAGGKTPASLVMKSAEQMAADLKATVLPRTQVLAVDAAARTVTLEGVSLDGASSAAEGHTLRYGQLVLALGADPIRLPIAGDAAARIRSVNDLDDFAAFLSEIEGAQRVTILGAGLIGCEFANDLLARGIQPTVIDPAPNPLGRLLPPEAGAWLKARLTDAGITFLNGVAAEKVEADGSGGLAVTLTDGSRLLTDAVLSAVGLRPRVSLAQAAGVTTARGVLTDRFLRTSAEGMFALGDCVEVQHDARSHVLPYVMPLMQQARALAATLVGKPTPVAYPAMPVTVKTPACPTVVCPPPTGAAVEWTSEALEGGCAALAHGSDGSLQGFALMGSATSRKQELVKALPPMMG